MKDDEFLQMIERLRRQGTDDARCEAKECAHRLSKDVWETVSAFANTAGGLILLGISETQGFAPVQGFEIERVRSQFLTGMGDGGSPGRVVNAPHYSIERHELEGEPVLTIQVHELNLSLKPCYIADRGVLGGSYKRVDDADVPLAANEVYSLQTADVVTDSDRQIVEGASVADLDEALVSQTFEKAKELAPRALRGANDADTKMLRLNLTVGGGGVTKAGLLAVGSYPQQFFPKLSVDVAVHPGTLKGGTDGQRFSDRVICEGTIGEMIEAATAAVSRNLRRVSVVRGVGRTDELEIPEEVLREAIANALIHREYDRRFDGQPVAVDVFDDRVEVTNPGGLWGKSRECLGDGRSCCRNATLMRLMSLVPVPSGTGSPAEGNGSGIPFMVGECRSRGLEVPEFRPAIDHFKVVLRRPASMRDLSAGRSAGEEAVASLLRRYGEMSVRDLEKMSGLSVSQVRNRVRKLLASGSIEATAPETSHNRKYRVKGQGMR